MVIIFNIYNRVVIRSFEFNKHRPFIFMLFYFTIDFANILNKLKQKNILKQKQLQYNRFRSF